MPFYDAFHDIHTAVGAASSVEEALEIFSRGYKFPFVTYHFAQAVGPGFDAPFVRTTYPPTWVARYLLHDYVKVDPVVREGFHRMLPFEWSEIGQDKDAVRLMTDAMEHGISPRGYSIPVIDKLGRRALLSINAAGNENHWPKLLTLHDGHWRKLAHLIHARAIIELYGKSDPAPRLGPRELECLHWTARGKDYIAIGIILGLSEHTVRGYLREARFKMSCSTLAQAVSQAIKLRIISP